MDWQLTSVVILVAAAVCYLFWSAWRTWQGGQSGCNKHCSCGPSQADPQGNGLISSENLQLRQRQPER